MEEGGGKTRARSVKPLGDKGVIGEVRQRCLHETCNQKSVPHPLFMAFLKTL